MFSFCFSDLQLTGVILRAAKRFQINVYVRKLDDFIETGNIQTLVFLVMYINESVLIDKETASRLKSVINTTLIVTNIPYIIMAQGVFCGLIFTCLACRGQGSTDEVSSGWRNVCLTGLCSLRTSAVLH